MGELTLIRHGESKFNQENRFCGWIDAELSENGIKEAQDAVEMLKKNNMKFDMCFTSVLQRAKETARIILEGIGQTDIPQEETWRLNERHYGALQGLNKAETAAKYGDEMVQIWRRSYATPPEPLDEKADGHPKNDHLYDNVPRSELPSCEALKNTRERVLPYFMDHIYPALREGKNVLIAAHGNSLRSLVMYLENISEDEITALNIPTAVPYRYKFDDKMNVVEHEYLLDAEEVAKKAAAVANQGKAKAA